MATTPLPILEISLKIYTPNIVNRMSLFSILFLKKDRHSSSISINLEEGSHDLNLKAINKPTYYSIT